MLTSLSSIGDGKGNLWTANGLVGEQVCVLNQDFIAKCFAEAFLPLKVTLAAPAPPSASSIQLFSLRVVGPVSLNARTKSNGKDGARAAKLDIKLSVQGL